MVKTEELEKELNDRISSVKELWYKIEDCNKALKGSSLTNNIVNMIDNKRKQYNKELDFTTKRIEKLKVMIKYQSQNEVEI